MASSTSSLPLAAMELKELTQMQAVRSRQLLFWAAPLPAEGVGGAEAVGVAESSIPEAAVVEGPPEVVAAPAAKCRKCLDSSRLNQSLDQCCAAVRLLPDSSR